MPVDRNTPLTGTAALIADAAIRVMVNKGLDALSVRNVAAEAGVAPGTVQYQMGTRDDIIAKAFMRSIQRQESRALRETDATDFHAVIHSRLAELLPIGPVQREDAAVWVIVGAAASTREWLADLYDAEVERFRARVSNGLAAAEQHGRLNSRLSPEQGARLVTALVNGLTIDYLNGPKNSAKQLLADLNAGLALIVEPSRSQG
ncbi:TetR/AcrR family transcriptional regulator [Dermabacter sp. Marseille-Q3180]|uniref:TetR/AcrR family transcriptional regulator n=1 Tax=Dermabacter sp. Marseille-Q3180 TaxID=2758090 RepID=UPI0020252B77|nr:TetR/AcrR family transcriptional regulator [Dermabacter sp. Marseille-Q3180]